MGEVAHALGVTIDAVKMWRVSKMPGYDGRKWHLPTVVWWLTDRAAKSGRSLKSTRPREIIGEQKPEPNEDEGGVLYPGDPQRENQHWLSKRNRLLYEQKRGELVEREQVGRLFGKRIFAVRVGLLSIGHSLAPTLAAEKDPDEIRKRVDDYVHELLSAYAAPLPEFEVAAEVEDELEESKPAKKKKSKRGRPKGSKNKRTKKKRGRGGSPE